MDTYHAALNAELNEADRWMARAQKDAVKAIVTGWKDCSRCTGKGYDWFLGSDRAPGICFKCSGKGKLIASRKEQAQVNAECQVIERNRLRFTWVAYNKALKSLDGNTHWSTKTAQESLARTMKNIEEAAAALPR